jgi:hypothetical protein
LCVAQDLLGQVVGKTVACSRVALNCRDVVHAVVSVIETLRRVGDTLLCKVKIRPLFFDVSRLA